MRILVVDDERCYGSLLASACKRLGHRAVVASDVAQAVEAAADDAVEAALLDLDLAGNCGIVLAQKLRGLRPGLPIGFCAGSASPGQLAAARERGPVLPKVWTVADVREVLTRLRGSTSRPPGVPHSSAAPAAVAAQPGRALARGSQPLPVQERAARETAGAPVRAIERVRVRCKTWERLRRLCDEQLAGRRGITVRVRRQLRQGEKVLVGLELPDEMVVVFAGKVLEVGASAGERREYRLELHDLDGEQARRLLAMAAAHGAPPTPPPTWDEHATTAETKP